MRYLTVCLIFCFHLSWAGEPYHYAAPSDTTPRIAIIIDDIGYNIVQGRRAVAINAPLTLAVLPHTPGTQELAKAAYATGKEIMLHAPMSNVSNKALGPGALTADMSQQQLYETLRDDINSIPHISGVNNHMGSELTAMHQPMQWVMDEIKKHNLFFIDSVTIGHSVALETARKNGILSSKRDVFLDNVQNEAYIKQCVLHLIALAKKNGYAIGIGHPHKETLNVLEQMLPELAQYGVELVPVSKLINFNKQLVKK